MSASSQEIGSSSGGDQMLLTTEDGRQFELNEREYNEFLFRFEENELVSCAGFNPSKIKVEVVR